MVEIYCPNEYCIQPEATQRDDDICAQHINAYTKRLDEQNSRLKMVLDAIGITIKDALNFEKKLENEM